MKPTKVSVRSGRTFNHPTEAYANFSFSLEAEYVIEESDAWPDVRAAAQAEMEVAADTHKARILSDVALRDNRRALEQQITRIKGSCDQLPGEKAKLAEIEALEARIKAVTPDQYIQLQLERELQPILSAHRLETRAEAVRAINYKVGNLRGAIKFAEQEIATLPELEAEYAALPQPYFEPEKKPQIHPGHPDHPATDAEFNEMPLKGKIDFLLGAGGNSGRSIIGRLIKGSGQPTTKTNRKTDPWDKTPKSNGHTTPSTRGAIKFAEQEIATLPELEAEYAALPQPYFEPEKKPQIHPGHPDHPATDAEFND